MRQEKVIGALIGLAGAVNNNGKTDQTDAVIREALLSTCEEEAVRRIHREKYIISPGCETCSFPCGNTSDVDITRFQREGADILCLKEEIVEELIRLAGQEHLPEAAYKAISYLGYEMTAETYRELLEELKA